jgi:hypothetical protein
VKGPFPFFVAPPERLSDMSERETSPTRRDNDSNANPALSGRQFADVAFTNRIRVAVAPRDECEAHAHGDLARRR